MASAHRPRRVLVGAAVVGLTTLGTAGPAVASPGDSSGGRTSGTCRALVDLGDQTFRHSTRIDNEYLPMVPGTRLIYRGTVAGDTGPERHEVVFTVTDLVKWVDGVRTRVIYDVDKTNGEVAEAELAFFAEDDAGIVWNLGEYPEEYENGRFAGAPSVWISGLQGATGGIHMLAEPEDHVGGPEYLQGKAPAIDFLDCARVAVKDTTVTVPAGRFHDVLTTYERSPLESRTALQTKEHAPGVGIVRIGAKNDPEGETLSLVARNRLGKRELAAVDTAAFRLDRHGHRVSDAYHRTPRIRHG
jgi:hypothetical protein